MDSFAERLAGRLQADPNDAEAYEALKAHYRERADLASLANLIEGWAGYQTDPKRASQGFLEAGRLVASGGKHAERSRELLKRAAARDLTNREAVLEVVQSLEASDPHQLAEFLDAHLRTMEERPEDRKLMASLYAQLGTLWNGTFERSDVARRCFERALELDPSDSELIDTARKLADSTGDRALLARVYGCEARAASEPGRQVELYTQQANLYSGELKDLDGAVSALRSALNSAPNDVTVMHQLASALSRRAATLSGDDALRDLRRVAELHFQIAQAVAPEDAFDYLEAALIALPSHSPSLKLLEELTAKHGRSELLPKYWLGYLASASEGPELDARRVSMAAAYERAGQLDDAVTCLEQVQTPGLADEVLAALRAKRGDRVSVAVEAAADNAEPTAKPPLRPRSNGDRPLDVGPLLLELRRQVRDAIAARRAEEAVERCREILELEPGDAEAFALLESHYRKTRDHSQLRELLLASTQISGVSVDVRKQRLREVAAISEAKLKDIEGAIEVWRSVVALDPADVEASKSLKRLLQRTARWDELAAVLEREALASQDTAEKTQLLAQIAAIHRDKRKDLFEAAEALRQLLALRPDPGTRDELCDMLLSIGSYADAAPLLRERVEDAANEREQLRLLRLLADTLETKLDDPEAAYQVYERALALRPKESEVLERMQRIDEQSGNTVRLLQTLERRTQLALRGERAGLLVHMAGLAEQKLDDVDRAAGYYAKALELEPGRPGLLDALSEMFEKKQRFADLVELLREALQNEREPARRVELLLRRARVLRDSLAKPSDAARAYSDVLAIQENAEALSYLLDAARQADDAEALADLAVRLAALEPSPEKRRALLYERAQILVTELGRPNEAVRTLRDLVENVDPNFEPAIDWLAELCGNLGDTAGLASALRRRLARAEGKDARVALAKRLSDLSEAELGDRDHAIEALLAWAEADPSDVAPHRRLRKLLEDAGRYAELVATCQALSELEEEPAARERATLDAAQIGFAQLGDVDAAFRFLKPLVDVGVPEALQLLSVVARGSGRSEMLAALCVRAAQEAKSMEIQGRLWAAAARTYAEDLENPTQALEAALRLLATDLKNRQYLTQLEDYAALAGGWTRLSPVYDRLLKSADSDSERVLLLKRYADLLEERAKSPSDAFDRILHACALAPADEGLMARAERLARASRRAPELLALCEAQARQSPERAAKVDWMLRAARFALSLLDERDPTAVYLGAALAASEAEPELWEQIVRTAVQLDGAEEEGEPQALLRKLVEAHRKIAEGAPATLGSALVLRGSRLLNERLEDERAAFDLLRWGSARFALDEGLYDALFAQAEALGRLEALDQHLARTIDEALDPQSAAAQLARRARLLEGPLARLEDAADVFAKLLQLRPNDLQAAAKLRDSLRRARRFQDLLLVIHKQMQRIKSPEEKLELLKESAQVWELDLKNRWEASDAWRKVLEFAPNDAEARRALSRLDRRSLPPAPESAAGRSNGTPDDAPQEHSRTRTTRSASDITDSTMIGLGLHKAEGEAGSAAPASESADLPLTAATNASETEAAPPSAAASEASVEVVLAPSTSAAATLEEIAEELPSTEITTLEDSQLDIAVLEASALDDAAGPKLSPPPPPPPRAANGQRGSSLPPIDASSSRPPAPPSARPASESAKRVSVPPPIPTRKS